MLSFYSRVIRIALASLLFGVSLASQATEKGLFWKLESPAGITSYLFGTMVEKIRVSLRPSTKLYPPHRWRWPPPCITAVKIHCVKSRRILTMCLSPKMACNANCIRLSYAITTQQTGQCYAKRLKKWAGAT